MNRFEHLLTILGEECAEVAQRASKALRFGLAEVQPGQALSNAERIVEELRDLSAVVNILTTEGVLPPLTPDEMRAHTERKRAKIERYMGLSRETGALTDDVAR